MRASQRDPVTSTIREAVLKRDDFGCIASYLGAPDGCRDFYGYPLVFGQTRGLTLDHVRDQAAMGGRRAPSDTAHLVTICAHHHLDGWATRNRPILRAYLEVVDALGWSEAARRCLAAFRRDQPERITT